MPFVLVSISMKRQAGHPFFWPQVVSLGTSLGQPLSHICRLVHSHSFLITPTLLLEISSLPPCCTEDSFLQLRSLHGATDARIPLPTWHWMLQSHQSESLWLPIPENPT